MPPIEQHHSAQTTKCLLIGDSGSGKTGALASLAAAGYNVRVLDLDNGIDILKNYLINPQSSYCKKDPACAKRVHYLTLTDKMRTLQGRIFPMEAKAWPEMIKMLEHWKEPAGPDYPAVDFGRLTEWTPQDILVIDSLSMLSTAALNYHLSINGALGGAVRTSNEERRDIWAAQKMLKTLLEMLYDSNVKCNIIVTSHIAFVTELGGAPKEGESQPMQGYPSAIGRALSPHIPRYFNTVLFAKTIGAGPGARHVIYTTPQGVVNVKSSAPLSVSPFYPLDTGLADYFAAIRKIGPAAAAQPKPAAPMAVKELPTTPGKPA